jgi:protein-S-isoprenylcysteine O-methyltransferase Ste14
MRQQARHSSIWDTPLVQSLAKRRFGDVLLFSVTLIELAILAYLSPAFTAIDWIYVVQHLVVLGIALTRPAPVEQDHSLATSVAVVVSYAYPYAQIIYLHSAPGEAAWPESGLVLVVISACLSFACLIMLGRNFGVRPALRGLTTQGPYRLVRHPIYLSYLIGDVGYNLQGWNLGLLLIMLVGWASLIYRIRAEERVLAHDSRWPAYTARVRYCLVPGIW